MADHEVARFRETVLGFYRENGRDLPWRRTRDPYRILVSEIMLQQTQVSRVLARYDVFLDRFPDLETLASSSRADVLSAWQGLGYNRRALALHAAAEIVTTRHGGKLPRSQDALRSLPGVGPATAGAIAAFAYGEPVPYIETNIRAAIIHHFFTEGSQIPDREVIRFVEVTLDVDDPRTWYYALMDYGSWLKKVQTNPSRRSRHHVVQSPFPGSRRQLRAEMLRLFLEGAPATTEGARAGGADRPVSRSRSFSLAQLNSLLPGWDEEQVREVADLLNEEGFLKKDGGFSLA